MYTAHNTQWQNISITSVSKLHMHTYTISYRFIGQNHAVSNLILFTQCLQTHKHINNDSDDNDAENNKKSMF